MSSVSLTPKETAKALISSAEYKAAMTVWKRLLMSVMAGIYIGLGAQGFILAYDSIFIRAAVFPVGLMLIILVGGELFTGNCLMTFALLQKKIRASSYVSVLLQVLAGNFLGGAIIAGLLYMGGVYNNPVMAARIIEIADAKLSLPFVQVVSKGILCNILVSSAVWFSVTSRDTTGKILGSWFPVMFFVLCGYEHVVANMFYLPMASFLDSSINIANMTVKNLIPAALGNYIGGGLIIPLIYHKVYFKD
jgi:formate/nitrite transporter